MPSLLDSANEFADNLEALLNTTVAVGAFIDRRLVESSRGAPYAILQPRGNGGAVPLTTDADRRPPGLYLRLKFTVDMDEFDEYLRVITSIFGLCINADTGRCAVRLEYDRNKTSRPAAHAQVDADSQCLQEAYRLAGREPRDISKLHIPVGHRRFRPSVEDFIEFLYQEKFISHLQPRWKKSLDASRSGWERRQLRAAIRRDVPTTVSALREHGYIVIPGQGILEDGIAATRNVVASMSRRLKDMKP